MTCNLDPANHRLRFTWFLALLGCVLTGCATQPFQPSPVDNPVAALDNLQTHAVDDVVVSAAILNDDQAQQHFGADLGARDLQAVWLRVRNGSDQRLWFLRNGVDPDLYSASEAALLVRRDVRDDDFATLQQFFRDQSIRVLIKPGYITEGFLFLPREEGGRYLEVRLAGDAWDREQAVASGGAVRDEIRIGFALTLPDGEFDYERLDTEQTYAGRTLPDLDLDGLRAELESLPCCAANKDGETRGDPLNVVMVGSAQDLMFALSRAGWSFTHRITPATVARMVGAALGGDGYPVAPVSALYAFDRKQDIALQRARRNIAQRNHMRLWLAPFTFEGRPVWLGQVSRDIGVKATTESPTLTTHIIDPEVDVTREYLLHSLLTEGFVERFGFVAGSRAATPGAPATNLVDDPWFSDGLRLVMMLSAHPVPYAEVRNLHWEQSLAPVAEGQSDAAEGNVYPIRP